MDWIDAAFQLVAKQLDGEACLSRVDVRSMNEQGRGFVDRYVVIILVQNFEGVVFVGRQGRGYPLERADLASRMQQKKIRAPTTRIFPLCFPSWTSFPPNFPSETLENSLYRCLTLMLPPDV